MFAKADEVGGSPNVVGQLYKIMAMLCFDMHRFNDAILNFIKSEKIIGIDMEVLQRKAFLTELIREIYTELKPTKGKQNYAKAKTIQKKMM